MLEGEEGRIGGVLGGVLTEIDILGDGDLGGGVGHDLEGEIILQSGRALFDVGVEVVAHVTPWD